MGRGSGNGTGTGIATETATGTGIAGGTATGTATETATGTGTATGTASRTASRTARGSGDGGQEKLALSTAQLGLEFGDASLGDLASPRLGLAGGQKQDLPWRVFGEAQSKCEVLAGADDPVQSERDARRRIARDDSLDEIVVESIPHTPVRAGDGRGSTRSGRGRRRRRGCSRRELGGRRLCRGRAT